MKQTDALGRATFYHITPVAGVLPTARELRWLKHIERHGPQASTYLHELTQVTHRCKDTALRALQKLRAAGLLTLPSQQRNVERAEFNPYVYDLSNRGFECLEDLDMREHALRPTGHWWHGYTTSCVTSSIDITATRRGLRYIPGQVILAKKNAPLAMPTSQGKLIPDQLFALDYGGRFRAFALEVDRGTEPKTSPAARKSYQKSIAQYAEVIGADRHKQHYGLKANLLVLWVFSNPGNMKRFLQLVEAMPPRVKKAILCQTLPPALLHKAVSQDLLLQTWQRASEDPVLIDGS